jgi:hypothetical protein
MNLAAQSIPPEIQNMMAGLFNALNLFEENLPASYVRAFVAVAKNEAVAFTSTCASATHPMEA